MKIGYTTGVFDLFHVGHLRLLKNSKEKCDWLIVGVSSDTLVRELKSKDPLISLSERVEIIKSIKYVDEVVVEHIDDKVQAWNELNFNIIFKGDDWKGSEKWIVLSDFFKSKNVEVLFLPYTKSTSSSLIKSICEKTEVE